MSFECIYNETKIFEGICKWVFRQNYIWHLILNEETPYATARHSTHEIFDYCLLVIWLDRIYPSLISTKLFLLYSGKTHAILPPTTWFLHTRIMRIIKPIAKCSLQEAIFYCKYIKINHIYIPAAPMFSAKNLPIFSVFALLPSLAIFRLRYCGSRIKTKHPCL